MLLKCIILFANLLSVALAILCRAGVDHITGPLADCGVSGQCMNTTSPQATVFSCDYGSICDVILNLQNGCILDGSNRVCCCSNGDECNFGGLPVSGDPRTIGKWMASDRRHNTSGATSKQVQNSDGTSQSTRNLPEEDASKVVKSSSLLDSKNF